MIGVGQLSWTEEDSSLLLIQLVASDNEGNEDDVENEGKPLTMYTPMDTGEDSPV